MAQMSAWSWRMSLTGSLRRTSSLTSSGWRSATAMPARSHDIHRLPGCGDAGDRLADDGQAAANARRHHDGELGPRRRVAVAAGVVQQRPLIGVHVDVEVDVDLGGREG